MDWDWPVFWDKFGIFADIVGVVSFIISIPTLLAARGAKKAVVEYKAVKRYDREINDHIRVLKGLHETISKDDAYGENVLLDITKELDTISIQYNYVVKPFAVKIKKLKATIDKTINQLGKNHNYNKRKIEVELNKIIVHLEKIKKENEL